MKFSEVKIHSKIMVNKIHYKERHFLPRTAFVVAVFIGSLLFLSNINSDEQQQQPSSLNHHLRSSRSLLQSDDPAEYTDPETVGDDDDRSALG